MQVQKIKKIDHQQYEILLENQMIILEEEIILRYRLLEGTQVSQEELQEIMKANQIQKLEHQAFLYSYLYGKSTGEVKNYLLNKDISEECADHIVHSLVEKKLCNDANLAQMLVSSYARNSNGPKMIRQKLIQKKFDGKTIAAAIQQVSNEDVEEGRQKLYQKAKKQYQNLPDFKQKQKIKECFFRHGYIELEEE